MPADLKRLLELAAHDAPAAAPPLAYFETRRTHRRQRQFALVAAVCVTALLAVGLAVVPRGGTPRPATSNPAPTAGVTAATLRTYTWRSIPAGPLDARSDAVAVWTGSQMLVWGGETDNGLLADGATFDPSSGSWRLLPDAPLDARAAPAATVVDGRVFIWGGRASTGPANWTTGGALYDPLARQWRTLPALDVGTYTWARAVTVGDRIVLLYANTDPVSTSTVVHATAFDPGTFRWQMLPDLALPDHHPSGPIAVAAVGADIYLWSNWAWPVRKAVPTGEEIDYTSGTDARALDVPSGRWSVNNLGPQGTQQVVGAQALDGRIVVTVSGIYCGLCKQAPLLNGPGELNGFLVDPGSGTTTAMRPGPVHDQLSGYLWTGGTVISSQWGGYTGGPGTERALGQTEAWDPRTNTWTVLRSAPRTGPNVVVVWTGTELIEWGAMYPVGSTNPGAQFETAGQLLGPP